MGNQFISVKEIARQTLPRLIENLVFPNLVFKDYSNDFVSGKGNKVIAQLPYYFTATEFNASSGTSASDIKQVGVDVELDKIADVSVEWGSIEAAVNMGDSKMAQIVEGMAAALAQKVNADGLDLYKFIPYVIGTAGTTPSALSDLSNVRKALNSRNVPLTDRRAVWDVDADAAFTQLGNLVKVSESGTPKALRDGEIGRVFGLDNYMSQAVKEHTQGTAISGNKTIAVAAAASAGADSISVDSAAAAGKLNAGDVIEIGDHVYNVAEDVAAISTTAATVKLAQPLAVNVAEDAAITFPTYAASKSAYAANLGFHRDAFAFVTRPLIAPTDKDSWTTSYNGVSLRVVKGYDMTYKKYMLSIDLVYGYKTLDERMAVVTLG